MNPLYHIMIGVPVERGQMSGWGFSIQLWPEWREAVALSKITQENVNHALNSGMGRAWLDGCGFDRIFDPDNCGFDRDKKKKPGPRAGPAYVPGHDLRISWGEWGPEHITVPGDACGLDLSDGIMSPLGGRILTPHNVDNMHQAMLLIVTFSFFAYSVINMSRKR